MTPALQIVAQRGDLVLRQRGQHFEILQDGILLLGTYSGDAEQRLVGAALAAAASPHRLLLGGLGVGFALGAALADPRVEEVTAVEPAGPLVEWNRTYLAPCSGHGLTDPRTRVVQAGLLPWLAGHGGRFDAICLEGAGLPWTAEAVALLRSRTAPAGAVAFWSSGALPHLERGLRQHFGRVAITRHELPGADPDFLYLAQP